MSDLHSRIDTFIRSVDRYLPGPASERSHAKAELGELLADAADAGELDAVIDQLGSPEAAAQVFTKERAVTDAKFEDRLVAATVDNMPLIAVTIGLLVLGITGDTGRFTVAFPPFVYVEFGNACIAAIPGIMCSLPDGGPYPGGLFYTLAMPIALAWSIVGLGLIESVTGTTPGKRMMGLEVVTTTGVRIKPQTGILRRLSFLVGPFAWFDWVPQLWRSRQRVLDHVAGTRVVVTPKSRR